MDAKSRFRVIMMELYASGIHPTSTSINNKRGRLQDNMLNGRECKWLREFIGPKAGCQDLCCRKISDV